MIIGISIPWYEMTCSYSTAVNVIPENTWFAVKGHFKSGSRPMKKGVRLMPDPHHLIQLLRLSHRPLSLALG